MNWLNMLKVLGAAAIGGGLTAGAAVGVDAGDLKHSLVKLGTIALAGAVTAVIHLFVPSPTKNPDSTPPPYARRP